MRMSYSSGTLLSGCKRKFWLKKRGVPIDADASQDTTALRVGKAFHQLQEDTLHSRAAFTPEVARKAWADNEIEEVSQQQMVLAMCQKYWDLHEKQDLVVICCETEIGDEDVIGYVDAVMADKGGYWFIVDLKTAGRLSPSLLSRLSRDVQLNLYSHYALQVADRYDLDISKFAGTRYRVTTKCTIKKQFKETVHAFRDRCYGKIESYDIFIPVEELVPQDAYDGIIKLKNEGVLILRMPEKDVPQNMSYCENYFKPCEWWSRCFNHTFTDGAKNLSLTDSINATNVATTEELL